MSSQSYLDTIDTIYPDGFVRERPFASAGDMVSPAPLERTGIWARIVERCTHWRARRAGRFALRELTDERLRDIGLTRADAERGVPDAQNQRKQWNAIVTGGRTAAAQPFVKQHTVDGSLRRAG